MQTAHSAPTAPAETLHGFLHHCHRLTHLGHTVTVAPLNPDDVAVLHGHGPHRAITFREGAPIEDLAYAAAEMWKLLAIGPAASTAIPARPQLHLVR